MSSVAPSRSEPHPLIAAAAAAAVTMTRRSRLVGVDSDDRLEEKGVDKDDVDDFVVPEGRSSHVTKMVLNLVGSGMGSFVNKDFGLLTCLLTYLEIVA
jgi:hypothetical protein